MLKGKNLYYVLGLGAVAYYFYWMNKKNKAAKVVSAPATNFTGDLGVPEYENAGGPSDRQFNRLVKALNTNPRKAERLARRYYNY
jgi:hypothetical protein